MKTKTGAEQDRLATLIIWILLLLLAGGCDSSSSGGGGRRRAPNQVPTIVDPGAQQNSEGDLVSLAIAASDPDGSSLSYAAVNLPAGLSIDPATGLISGVVDANAAAGSPYQVTISVSDGDATLSVTFSWTVTPSNQAPVVQVPSTQITTEGDAILFRISADDPDGDSLQYSARNLPADLMIDAHTGEVSGQIVVPAADESPYTVTVTVSDGATDTDVSFTWRVRRAPPATVSGKLLVSPDNILEVEPNDTLGTAQRISSSQKVAGFAAAGDAGLGSTGGRVHDLYRVETADRVRITLTIAEDDFERNDLDIVLLDEEGSIVEASQGTVDMEVLETPAAGTVMIGIQAVTGSSAYVLSVETAGDIARRGIRAIPLGAAFVPGQVLVKERKRELPPRTGLRIKEALPGDLRLLEASPDTDPSLKSTETKRPLSRGAVNALRSFTLRTVAALGADPTVEYAQPNYIYTPSRTPNDDFYQRQWHYELINLPQAWERTVGSSTVIVAVIDTGVLLDHPDLQGRLMGGYDFIADPSRANDGDGRDGNPDDPGDDPEGFSSSFHGTHVAGTVGAATNNELGVAGVTWETRIMPVRVLGVDGATDPDLAEAIKYAAGLPNVSGEVPAERAHIINLSLGGSGFSMVLNDAVQAARAAGVIIVAAAGNDNTSSLEYPAAFDGVIAVAAVNADGLKASYSNFGSTIDVAAPGGNLAQDLDGNRFPDGVLSTCARSPTRFNYALAEGTSMATPHVAGVIALMLSVNPSLTPTDIDHLLAGTHFATGTSMTRDLGRPGRDDLYGHGLIDATQAVLAALQAGGPTPRTDSALVVSPTEIDFANFLEAITLNLTNAGSDTLTITAITADQPWITVTPTSGTAPLSVQVAVDRSGLAAGTYQGTITITSDAVAEPSTATVSVRLEVGGATVGNVGTVYVLLMDVDTAETADQTETDRSREYRFEFPRAPDGTYYVVAGTDRDQDQYICDMEDACGFYPDPLEIIRGRTIEGIDIIMSQLISPQAAAAPRHTGQRGSSR